MTVIYPSPIFGPVKSRRLGISLGINLQPDDGKLCSFDCLYCECGLNKQRVTRKKRPSRDLVKAKLEESLVMMKKEGALPDVLTFAGNGEPTGHPDFLNIIKDTITLRNRYCPDAKISVLSNATFCDRQDVFEALMLVDNNILKLDTVCNEYIRIVDRPAQPGYDVRNVVKWIKRFNGHCIIQTMFLKGRGVADADEGSITVDVNNVKEEYIAPWIEALTEIAPQKVMIYTIDRETPVRWLEKATHEELDAICERVRRCGIDCSASY